MADLKLNEAGTSSQEEIRKVLDIPAVVETDRIYSTYRDSLMKGTCEWLLEESPFKSWIRGDTSVLWILGGPGAGKSYLSTWTITHVLKLCSEESAVMPNASAAYVYIKENDESLREANALLKIMAWQLSCADALYKSFLSCVEHISRVTTTAADTWNNLFLAFYQTTEAKKRHAVLVVDGVDEAPRETRTQLIKIAKEIMSAERRGSSCQIRLLLVGRRTIRADI